MNCVRAARSGTSLSTRLYIYRYAASTDSCRRAGPGAPSAASNRIIFRSQLARKEEEVVVARLRLDAVCVCSHNRYAVMIASDGALVQYTECQQVQSGVGAVVE